MSQALATADAEKWTVEQAIVVGRIIAAYAEALCQRLARMEAVPPLSDATRRLLQIA